MQRAGNVEAPTPPPSHTSDSLALMPLSKNMECGVQHSQGAFYIVWFCVRLL